MKAILNKETGRYELEDGRWLSSPSRMLKPLSEEKYKDINPHFLQMAADFGKEAHSNIEIYEELGADSFAEAEVRDNLYSTQHENVFNQFLEWKKEYGVEVVENEKVVYSEHNRYFGYVDMIVEINGEKFIVDLKTRASLDNEDLTTEILQLMFYQAAYHEMTGEMIEVALLIINKKTKSKRLFKIINNSEMQKLRQLFHALLSLNRVMCLHKDKKAKEEVENV